VWRLVGLCAALVFFTLCRNASCAIRVVDDEVVFSLRAPGASTVFLIGDFNNWNATVEPLTRDGDNFEISLFLVEGSYRYKFVVDGRTIVDPANRGDHPELGSPLTLIERAGGLVMSTEETPVSGTAGVPVYAATPAFRYIGEFRDAERPFHWTEFGVEFARDRLRGRGTVASDNGSWRDKTEDVVIGFNGGYVDVDVGAFVFRGFEDDSTWHSSDPLVLVGHEGVFGYDAGYGRKGIGITSPANGTVVGRAMYADDFDRSLAMPMITSDALASFAAGSEPDTTVYMQEMTRGDADRLAIELLVDTGQLRGGYVRRSDRGLHPGLIAEIARDSTVFDIDLSETRETNTAALYWLAVPDILGATVTLGYGSATTALNIVGRESRTSDLSTDLAAIDGSRGQDASLDMVDSRRAVAAVDGNIESLSWGLSWDFTRYDFEPLVGNDGRADVHHAAVNLSIAGDAVSSWMADATIGFTDRSYDNAPDDFSVDATSMNPWLGGRDDLSVTKIVALDWSRYLDLRVSLAWYGRSGTTRWVPTEALLTLNTVAGGDGAPDYLAANLHAERVFATKWSVAVDGRMARYDRPSIQINDTFLSGYIECGYKATWLSVNVGFGFDPVVFDDTISDYNDIGTLRTLRSALAQGIRRSGADDLVLGLVEAERKLEGDNTIKLECIIWF